MEEIEKLKNENAKLKHIIFWLIHSHDPGCDECGEHGGCPAVLEGRYFCSEVKDQLGIKT